MSGPPATTCRSCRRPVRWATTTRGKRMILDAAPVPNGNLVLRAGQGRTWVAHYLSPLEATDEPRYVAHFATCPEASRWRKTDVRGGQEPAGTQGPAGGGQVPRGPRHRCPARDCEVDLPAQFLMCRPHWYLVPRQLRSAVWRHYQAGQGEPGGPRPTLEWLAAVRAAVAAVDRLSAA